MFQISVVSFPFSLLRSLEIYPNNLKNRFLALSASPQIFRPALAPCLLALPLARDEKSGTPPCQIPDSSGCLGIIMSYELKKRKKKEKIYFLIVSSRTVSQSAQGEANSGSTWVAQPGIEEINTAPFSARAQNFS